MEKIAEKVDQKLVPVQYFILVNSWKCSQGIQETLFDKRILKKHYPSKNLILIFFFEPSPFLRKLKCTTKGAWNYLSVRFPVAKYIQKFPFFKDVSHGQL